MRTPSLILVALLLAACADSPGPHSASSNGTLHTESHALTFTDPDGRVYDALLSVPDSAHWNRHTALLLGGGTVTDMHWTVPASVEYQGRPIPLTTTGEPTRDADTIAAALVSAGFAVMQYSSIRRADVDAIDEPALADYIPYATSRDIAVAALAALRDQPGIIPSNIVLVGHSLGGARALQIAATDPGICALVLLASAYASRLGVRPSLAAEETIEALKKHGLDADAGIPRYVFNAKHALLPPPLDKMHFDTLDRDDDETLRRWEIAAAIVLAHLDAGDTSDLTDATDLDGAPFPADVLTPAFDRHIPTLAIFGGLDTMSVHAPLLARTAASRAEHGEGFLSVVVLAHLGHDLGPVRPRDNAELIPIAGAFLTGPIDPGVPDLIARWLTEVLERTPLEHSAQAR